jgi:hypothetical protein
MNHSERRPAPAPSTGSGPTAGPTPGKRARTDGMSAPAAEPLPPAVQAPMEASFGADLSAVRVHTGSAAAEAAGADAMASGSDLHFAPGAWSPDSADGLALIGHELAHVVQQASGRVAPGVHGKGMDVNRDPGLEAEADDVGARAARGERVATAGRIPTMRGPTQLRRRLMAGEEADQWAAFDTGDQPLAEPDAALGAALAANRGAGFSTAVVALLREAVGVPVRPREINVQFVTAVRAFQGGAGRASETVTETARARSTGDGDVSAGEGAPSRGITLGSGLLDPATLRALDVPHHTAWGLSRLASGQARAHHRRAPWATMTAEQRTAAIAATRAALGDGAVVVEGDPANPTILIDVAAAIHWQLVARPGEPAPVRSFGAIGAADLEAMGLALAATAAVSAEDAPADGPPMPDGGPDGAPDEEATDAAGLTVPQRALLTELRDDLDAYLRERTAAAGAARRAGRRPRGEDAAIGPAPTPAQATHAVDERHDVEAIARRIEELGVPGLSGPEIARPRGAAEHYWARQLLGLVDDVIAPALLRAGSGRHRRTAAELEAATTRLEDDGYLVRREVLDMTARDATGAVVNDGYNLRLTTAEEEAAHVTPLVIARRAVASLDELLAELAAARDHLDDAVAAARVRGAPQATFDAVHQQLAADRAEPWTVPRVMRHHGPWRPSSLTAPLRATLPPREDHAGLLRHAGEWSRALRAAHGETQEQHGRSAQYRTAANPVTRGAVIVDLHRTGVEICWNPGGTLPVAEMHLNPAFAERMVSFLTEIRSLGVARLFTAGFLRAPMSPADSHPFGRAVDITGFGLTDGREIRLRSGYPLPGSTPADVREHYARGHSDWFEGGPEVGAGGAPSLGAREIMLALAVRLPGHFSTIVGPGHNAEHMNHFHCEISNEEGEDEPGVFYAMSDPSEMPRFAQPRIARASADPTGEPAAEPDASGAPGPD